MRLSPPVCLPALAPGSDCGPFLFIPLPTPLKSQFNCQLFANSESGFLVRERILSEPKCGPRLIVMWHWWWRWWWSWKGIYKNHNKQTFVGGPRIKRRQGNSRDRNDGHKQCRNQPLNSYSSSGSRMKGIKRTCRVNRRRRLGRRTDWLSEPKQTEPIGRYAPTDTAGDRICLLDPNASCTEGTDTPWSSCGCRVLEERHFLSSVDRSGNSFLEEIIIPREDLIFSSSSSPQWSMDHAVFTGTLCVHKMGISDYLCSVIVIFSIDLISLGQGVDLQY